MTDLRDAADVVSDCWLAFGIGPGIAIIEADRAAVDAAARADERAKVVAWLRTLDEASWSIDEIADFIKQEFSHE